MIIWRIPNSSGIPIAWVTVDYQSDCRQKNPWRSFATKSGGSVHRQTPATRQVTLGRQRRSVHQRNGKKGKESSGLVPDAVGYESSHGTPP